MSAAIQPHDADAFSEPMPETTFADGFGNWHALVRRDRIDAHILVARSLIRDQLTARGEGFLAVDIQRTPLYDTETHLAFGETGTMTANAPDGVTVETVTRRNALTGDLRAETVRVTGRRGVVYVVETDLDHARPFRVSNRGQGVRDRFFTTRERAMRAAFATVAP